MIGAIQGWPQAAVAIVVVACAAWVAVTLVRGIFGGDP